MGVFMKSTEIDRCWSSGKLSGGVFRCRIPLLGNPSGVRKAYCSPPPEGQWGGEVSRTAGDLAGTVGVVGWAGPAEGGWAAGAGRLVGTSGERDTT